MMNKNKKTLVFHHIPKAGGTTLNAIIRQNCDPRRTYSIYDTDTCHSWEEYRALSEVEKSNLDAVMGHMPMGAHRELSREVDYITFFRDPLKRVLSLYRYVFRKEDHYLYEQATREQFSLDRFLDVAPSFEVENGMVKALLFPEELPDGHADESHLQKALENLDEYFPVFGLTHEFDASVCLFARYFGWKTPYYMVRNARRAHDVPEHPEPLEEELLRLRELNALDLRLYDEVQVRFSAMLERELGHDRQQLVEHFSCSNTRLPGKSVFVYRALLNRFRRAFR